MKEINITEKDLENYYVFDKGFESIIYLKDNETLLKKYHEINYRVVEKIKYFHDLNLEYICNPEKLLNIDGNISGYSMKNRKYCYPIMVFKNFPISERIKLLEKIKNILKNLHKNNIVYGDLNVKNILSNGTDVYLTDIVNAKIPDYDFTEISRTMHEYRENKGKMDVNLDNYMLNLLTIYMLNDEIEYENILEIIYNILFKRFNNQETEEIIGLTDNIKCMDIGYKMLDLRNGVDELIIDHIDKELYKYEAMDKKM